jgi:hypothetical protein
MENTDANKFFDDKYQINQDRMNELQKDPWFIKMKNDIMKELEDKARKNAEKYINEYLKVAQ